MKKIFVHMAALVVAGALAGCDGESMRESPSTGTNTNNTGTSSPTADNENNQRDRTAAPGSGAATPPGRPTGMEEPDNTGRNDRDAGGDTKTPMDQSNDQRDIDITAEIRRAITDDDSMSTNARNVKIITNKGSVTLRGVVESQAEKDAIEAKAKAVAGVQSVDNQLEINTP